MTLRVSISFTLLPLVLYSSFFFFNDTATTEIYTLSLHDALPICARPMRPCQDCRMRLYRPTLRRAGFSSPRIAPGAMAGGERESTPLESNHSQKSYSAFFF